MTITYRAVLCCAVLGRYLTLTHNCHDTWVDSQANACLDNADCKMGDGDVCVDGRCAQDQLLGLTDFGKEVLFEMNRLGMLYPNPNLNP